MNLTKITDTVYTLTESTGNEYATVILIYLFPGIILGINDIHIRHIMGSPEEVAKVVHTDYLRFNYCLEGRCEVKLKDGRYVYVDNNVLCIEDHPPQYNFYYPLGFYKGIEIHIDKENISKKTIELLELLGINPLNLIHEYGNKDQTFINFASELFAQKSADMISIWENEALSLEMKVSELRFALCRLLYYLVNHQAVNLNKTYHASFLSQGQYMIALDCEKRITTNLIQKHTTAELASHYKISPASLKKFFSQVYGCSISEYLQTVRMKEAARLLTEESLSVMDIAASVGYENQSKFSAVFKKHTGYAPLEYKRIHNIKEVPSGYTIMP